MRGTPWLWAALANFSRSRTIRAGVGDGLAKDGPGLRPEGGLQLGLGAVGVDEGEVDAHALHRDGEEVIGTAVDGGGAHHMFPAGDNVKDGVKGSRLTGGGQHGRGSPLQAQILAATWSFVGFWRRV